MMACCDGCAKGAGCGGGCKGCGGGGGGGGGGRGGGCKGGGCGGSAWVPPCGWAGWDGCSPPGCGPFFGNFGGGGWGGGGGCGGGWGCGNLNIPSCDTCGPLPIGPSNPVARFRARLNRGYGRFTQNRIAAALNIAPRVAPRRFMAPPMPPMPPMPMMMSAPRQPVARPDLPPSVMWRLALIDTPNGRQLAYVPA